MTKPTSPDDDRRLAELKRLAAMDSGTDRAYDDITRLAADMCGTPVALISLVDDKRQWFKSRVGIQVSETPREMAFCSVAIRHPDTPLIVPDALQDVRFAHNPLVTGDPKIRFYAGAPLITASGQALGTVCVIDTQPRQLNAAQIETLQFLAQQVVAKLEADAAARHERPASRGQDGSEGAP